MAEAEVTVELHPGQAASVTVAINGLQPTELLAEEAKQDDVRVSVGGSALNASAAVSAPTGPVDIVLTTIGCLGDTCDVSVQISVTVEVLPFPDEPTEAAPLLFPASDRLVDTDVKGVYAVIDEVIVIGDDSFDPSAAALDLGVTFSGGIPEMDTWQFVTTDSRTFSDLQAIFGDYPGVETVLPQYVGDLDLPDAVIPGDWNDDGPRGTWQFDTINATELWAMGRSAPDVKVGIIDAGIWRDHEDINVMERYGYCTLATCTDSVASDSHGTHVAGLACADDQGVGLVGMAWGCELYAVDIDQASDIYFTNATFSSMLIVDAMQRVVDMGVDVVNMSLGFPDLGPGCHAADDQTALIASEMGQLLSQGISYGSSQRSAASVPDIVWIVSAGNDCFDARNKAPAQLSQQHSNIATVASVDSDGHLSSFSNSGPAVTIAAPGGYFWNQGQDPSGIWSAVANCDERGCSSDYAEKSGTSMAAPIIAGLVALMRQNSPDLEAEEIVRCLTVGSQPVTERHETSGWNPMSPPDLAGVGLVNAPAAFSCATASAALPLDNASLTQVVACGTACEISSSIGLDHPTWGPITLATYVPTGSCDPYGIVAIDRFRDVVWSWTKKDETCWYELIIGSRSEYPRYQDDDIPATKSIVVEPVDSLGHIFLSYNPGRYDGHIVLSPTSDGFEDFGTLPPDDFWAGRFYFTETVDIDSDGQFEILQLKDLECTGCRRWVTGVLAPWNGTDYQVPFSFRETFYQPGERTAAYSGCTPDGFESLPDGVWVGFILENDGRTLDFGLACLGMTDDGLPALITDTEPLTRKLVVSDSAISYTAAAYRFWNAEVVDEIPMTCALDSGCRDAVFSSNGLDIVVVTVNNGQVTEIAFTDWPK